MMPLLVLALTVTADSPAAALQPFQGTWQAVSVEEDGKVERAQIDTRFVVKEDKFTMLVDGKDVFRGVLAANSKTNQLDCRRAVGDVVLLPALYMLDGDTLTVCTSGDDDRPKDFKASRGSGNRVAVYQRKK